MMMRQGHIAFSVPVAIGEGWAGTELGLPWAVAAAMAALTVYASDWPDFDHPTSSVNNDLGPITQAIGLLIRQVAWAVWVLTARPVDKHKRWGDCHRDFTHSLEGAAVFGGVTTLGTLMAPGIGTYAWCWGLAAFIGCVCHMGADSLTPSGVPWSITYNALTGDKVWQRRGVGWRMVSGWVPVPAIVKAGGRRPRNQINGLFTTNSGGERAFIFLAIWPLSFILVLLTTGTLMPIIHLIIGS